MTFAHPWVLLLLAVPALLLWSVPYRGAGLVFPFDHQSHGRRRGLHWLLTVFDCVPAVMLAAAIVMLAGPQVLKQPRRQRMLTNIQICMDVSGSMSRGDRYDMAREAIEEFVDARAGDAFGLTLFGSYQIRWTPLTKDLSAVRNALPFADPDRQPRHMSGTRIGAALRFCLDNMIYEAEEGDRMIILVSDGASSDLGDDNAQTIADALSEARITVYHVHVGAETIPPAVAEIAKQTGGRAFAARDPRSLENVFRHIDRMRPATFKPGGHTPMDHFEPFAIVGLACLGLHIFGLLTVRHTPW